MHRSGDPPVAVPSAHHPARGFWPDHLRRTTLRRACRCRTLRTRRRLTPGRSCRSTRRSTSAGWARDVGLRLTLRSLILRWLSLRRRGLGSRVLSSGVLSSGVLSWLPLRLTRRLGSALPRRRLAATSLIGHRLRRSLTVTLCRSYRRSRSHRRSGRSLTLGRTRNVGSPTRDVGSPTRPASEPTGREAAPVPWAPELPRKLWVRRPLELQVSRSAAPPEQLPAPASVASNLKCFRSSGHCPAGWECSLGLLSSIGIVCVVGGLCSELFRARRRCAQSRAVCRLRRGSSDARPWSGVPPYEPAWQPS